MLVLMQSTEAESETERLGKVSTLLVPSAILPSKTFSHATLHDITLPLRIRGGGALATFATPTHPVVVVSSETDSLTMKQFTTGKDPAACVEERFFQCICEKQHLFSCPSTFSPNASYVPYRRFLVDWMSAVGEKLDSSPAPSTVLSCILTKSCEHEMRFQSHATNFWRRHASASLRSMKKLMVTTLPSLPSCCKLPKSAHALRTFRDEGEVRVLQYLGYRLSTVPPLLVVEYFLPRA
jgi:hypothetical protein